MKHLPQVGRFLLLGGLAAAINWIVRIPLSLIMPFSAAILLAYGIGMTFGFTFYRAYVFPGSSRPLLQQTLIFLVVNFVGAVVVLAVATLLLAAMVDTGWSAFVRQAVAHGLAIGIGAVFNFFGHKLLTFRNASPQ